MPVFNLSAPGSVDHVGAVLDRIERNRYDDSDYLAIVWDAEIGAPREVLYASTRFGGDGSATVDATPEIRSCYEGWIAAQRAAKEEARKASPMPDDLRVGARVSWLRESKSQAKSVSPCAKCAGEGCWINPRNTADRRPCFGCNGQGTVTGAKLVDDKGKAIWNKIAKGTEGEVIDWTSFGTFYRSGYNQPNRDNTSVKVKLDDGRTVSATLAALRLV